MSKTYKLQKSLPVFLFAHFYKYAFHYLLALVCLYLLHYFQMLLPEWAKQLAEVTNDQKQIEKTEILKFILLALAIIIFRTASRLFFFMPARYQQRDLRVEIIEMLEVAHPRKYKDFNEGQIYQITFNDLNRIRGFIGFGLLQMGNIIIASYVIIPKVISLNAELMYAFIPMILGVIIFAIISLISEPYSKKNSKAQGELQNFIIESYNAKATIKNYHSENSFIKKFIDLSSFEMKQFFYASMGPTLSIPLTRLSFGASLLWGAYLIFKLNLGASTLIYFSGVIFLASEPLAFLSWIGVVFTSGYAGWKRVKELTNAVSDLPQPNSGQFKDIVEFELWGKNTSLKLNKNSWSVFIGQTGSGKSWCLKSIAEQLGKFGQSYSLVIQEPYLYNDTIGDNIFLGKTPSEEDTKLCHDLIKLFGLEILADTIEEVLKLEVGENGKKVSGGQAKRICLLRSVFADTDWILWDDPFSSVDLILESQILQKLKNHQKLKNKNFVLTSHRISTVRNCQHVVYLEKDKGIVAVVGENKEEKERLVSEYFSKQFV